MQYMECAVDYSIHLIFPIRVGAVIYKFKKSLAQKTAYFQIEK